MYGSDYTILAGLIGLAALITFFVMAFKLSKILNILEFFRDIELRKPENWTQMKCEKCGHEFRISKAAKGHINCPKCKAINEIKHQ